MSKKIAVIGAGSMGSGIAQVALMNHCQVFLYDTNLDSLSNARVKIESNLQKLEAKGKLENAASLIQQLTITLDLHSINSADLVIEAIVENLEIKKKVFQEIESLVSDSCILASNTSSLSITSIAAACKIPERCIGIHFFNPAPLMALVEIIPAIQTVEEITTTAKTIIDSWGKKTVIAKDTPGFIVNRIARPFYSEAIKMMEEGIATKEEIDASLKSYGGFRMGPFELTDYIGHDVNYVVTETVYHSFFYDNKYKPSFSQKRLLEAGWLGRKTKRGFYDYRETDSLTFPIVDELKAKDITERIVALLINEAVDALYLNIANAQDIETAMTLGVNYPKGLLSWCNEWGAEKVLRIIDNLFNEYHDEKYRASILLRNLAENKEFIKI